MGHYSRVCPNFPILPSKKNMGSFIRRFSAKEKGKSQVHLIEPMNKGREMAFMGFGKELQNSKGCG
jgi:hypothetical protein